MVKLAGALILASLTLAVGCSSNDDSTHKSSASAKSSDTVSKDDAYNIGCPALDTALGAGSFARKAASTVLGGLAGSDSVSADQKEWLNDAKQLLATSKPEDVPGSVRSRVSKACSQHGHPLANL